MPYTKSNVKTKIPGTKNLSDKELEVFISVANERLESGISEEKAIATAYAAAKKADMNKSKLIDTIFSLIDCFGPPQEDRTAPLMKAFDDELREEISVVYMPNTPDAHGEWMSESTVASMAVDLKKGFESGKYSLNLFHKYPLEKSEVEVLDVWLLDDEVTVGDKYAPAGTCVMKKKYHNKKLWELRKAGIIGGDSVHGKRKKMKRDNK